MIQKNGASTQGGLSIEMQSEGSRNKIQDSEDVNNVVLDTNEAANLLEKSNANEDLHDTNITNDHVQIDTETENTESVPLKRSSTLQLWKNAFCDKVSVSLMIISTYIFLS